MTFGQEYLTHLRVIQNIGMARIDPIIYNGVEIVPIQFLKPCFRTQVAGSQLPRPDLDRLPHPGYQGRQGAYVLYLQQLRSREGVPGDRYAGRELYYGRSGGAGRFDVGQGALARCGRVQRRGVRS